MTYVCAGRQEKQTHADDENINKESDPAPNSPFAVESWPKICLPHPDVRRAPEDPAEE